MRNGILRILTIACVFAMQLTAVKANDTLTIYKDGFVTARIPVASIDSMNFNSAGLGMTIESFINLPAQTFNNLVAWNFTGTGTHDSFGIMAILHATDMMSEDIVSSKLSHFTFDYGLENKNFNYRRPTMLWRYLTDVVHKSNRIINNSPLNSQNEQVRFTIGQAYALRAYAYYYLVQLFQFTAYPQFPQNLSLPTVPLLYAAKEGKPDKKFRVPASEVLAQIESDLLTARGYLQGLERTDFAMRVGAQSSAKQWIDANVVEGLLARYYLLTGKWAEAVTAARSAMQGYEVMNQANIMDGFKNIENPEWMWGFDHNTVTSSLYASFFSHISNLSPGYAGLDYAPRHIDKRLYEQIPSNDARKMLFQNPTGTIDYYNMASPSATTWRKPYANLKFGWSEGFTQDYLYMRASEMVLIEAEALAHQSGKAAEAAVALKKLMDKRDPSWNMSSVTVDDVWMQRRIELWGEGFAYFDLKRLNKGIDRTYAGTNHEPTRIIAVPANDHRWNFDLPTVAYDEYPELTVIAEMPVVGQPELDSITGRTFTYKVAISQLNEAENHVKGIAYTQDPEFKSGIINANSLVYASNIFSGRISGLQPETTYYARAFYRSAKGNVYSQQTSFTTTKLMVPDVTINIGSITDNSVALTGNYQFVAPLTGNIISKGFEIAYDSVFSSGKSTREAPGGFETTFENLTSATEHYVRAFASTIDGTAYSPTLKFTTTGTISALPLPFSLLESNAVAVWQNAGLVYIDADGDGRHWAITYLDGATQSKVGLVSYSWFNTPLEPENYVILPAMQLGGGNNTFSIDVRGLDVTYYKERFKVIISTQPITTAEHCRNATTIYARQLMTSMVETISFSIPESYRDQVVWIGIAHFDTVDEYGITITNIKVY